MVLGSNGQPVDRTLLLLEAKANPDLTFDVTGVDGTFIAKVPNGRYTIAVRVNPPGECFFVGWYGEGGFTTDANRVIPIEVAGQDVLSVEIKLLDELENLPYIERCAT